MAKMFLEVGDCVSFDEMPDSYPFGFEGRVMFVDSNTGTTFVLVPDVNDHSNGMLIKFSDAWGSWDCSNKFKIEWFGFGTAN